MITGMLQIYFSALGCKLNQAEVDALTRQVANQGMVLVTLAESADWIVVNTCTVTQTAAQKSRQLVRHLNTVNSRAKIAVTGCYATMSAGEVQALPGVALVIPNDRKASVLEEIVTCEQSRIAADITTREYRGLRTRTQVKIQDGCDNTCTYCIVRIARGAQRSTPPAEVIAEVQRRCDEGYNEVVLTGVHIGAYGRDSAPGAPLTRATGWNLAQLVEAILSQTTVPRLRLSSVEPWDVTPALVALWPEERLCRHLHLPIQSGSDAVLGRMNRNYTRSFVVNLVEDILAREPDMAITIDLITGFPGENEHDHQETCDLVQRLGLARLHVFPFSARPGTLAQAMPDQVAPVVVKQRSKQLIALGRELDQAYRQRYLGHTVKVLLENRSHRQGKLLWSGLSDNYLRVYAETEANVHNRFALVLLTELSGDGIYGRICDMQD